MIWWILIQHVQTQIQIRNSFYYVSSDSSSDDCFCLFSLHLRCLLALCSFVLLYLAELVVGSVSKIAISSGVNSCSVSLLVYTCLGVFFVLLSESSELLQTASIFLGGFVDFSGFDNNVCKSVLYCSFL